jgi:hypothetical protein
MEINNSEQIDNPDIFIYYSVGYKITLYIYILSLIIVLLMIIKYRIRDDNGKNRMRREYIV